VDSALVPATKCMVTFWRASAQTGLSIQLSWGGAPIDCSINLPLENRELYAVFDYADTDGVASEASGIMDI
jgi:hypothetical protein